MVSEPISVPHPATSCAIEEAHRVCSMFEPQASGGAVWWRGRFNVAGDHYTIGRPRGEFPDAPQPGLFLGRGGLLVITGLNTTAVELEVRCRITEAHDTGFDAIAEVPQRGWRLRAEYEDVAERSPRPLLGRGQWGIALQRTDPDFRSRIEQHSLTLYPLDDQALDFAQRRRPYAPSVAPTGRDVWDDDWYPKPGRYVVGVRRASDATLADAEQIVHEREAEWWLTVKRGRWSPTGEKWAIRRKWTLRDGDELVVADSAGSVPDGMRCPIAKGPAAVRLLTQRPDVGDFVNDQWVSPDTDGIRLDVLLDGP
ncbi:hypothetical protein AB3X52_08345 [Nocardioides sp. DS6]|uniref:Uncharacterized protein n=1 Tax=Nocardioides eburneus TaxID=3231482 RepID=A0ABV3SXG1_9ACTN